MKYVLSCCCVPLIAAACSAPLPLRVHIRNELAGGPPYLPKMNPPKQCASMED